MYHTIISTNDGAQIAPIKPADCSVVISFTHNKKTYVMPIKSVSDWTLAAVLNGRVRVAGQDKTVVAHEWLRRYKGDHSQMAHWAQTAHRIALRLGEVK